MRGGPWVLKTALALELRKICCLYRPPRIYTSYLLVLIIRNLLDLLLGGLPFHDLVALLHHIRIQNVRSRHVNGQDSVQHIWKSWVDISRRANSLVNQATLRSDSEWVKHKEGVVSQPAQNAWVLSGESQGEVSVTDDLGDGVSEQHGGECWVGGEVWEGVDDAPGEEEAGGDLHDGGHYWGADDAWLVVSLFSVIPTSSQNN